MKRHFRSVLAVLAVAGLAACARPLATEALSAGVKAARADDWEAAVRYWTEAVRRDPGSAAARNNLAIAFEKRGEWADARRAYEEALRLDPDNRTVRENYDAFLARLESARGRMP